MYYKHFFFSFKCVTNILLFLTVEFKHPGRTYTHFVSLSWNIYIYIFIFVYNFLFIELKKKKNDSVYLIVAIKHPRRQDCCFGLRPRNYSKKFPLFKTFSVNVSNAWWETLGWETMSQPMVNWLNVKQRVRWKTMKYQATTLIYRFATRSRMEYWIKLKEKTNLIDQTIRCTGARAREGFISNPRKYTLVAALNRLAICNSIFRQPLVLMISYKYLAKLIPKFEITGPIKM